MTLDFIAPYSRSESQAVQPPFVLAIDDDNDNLLLLSYILEMLGCPFISESDSQLVFSLTRERQPDLILLDILLPNLSGIDVIRQLKRDSSTCHIPVVAVTALAGEDDQKQLLEAGFTGYICKPYMIEDLEAVIRHYSRPCENAPVSIS